MKNVALDFMFLKLTLFQETNVMNWLIVYFQMFELISVCVN